MNLFGTEGSFEDTVGSQRFLTKGREIGDSVDVSDLLTCRTDPAHGDRGGMRVVTSRDGTHLGAAPIHPIERLPREFGHAGSHQFLVDAAPATRERSRPTTCGTPWPTRCRASSPTSRRSEAASCSSSPTWGRRRVSADLWNAERGDLSYVVVNSTDANSLSGARFEIFRNSTPTTWSSSS